MEKANFLCKKLVLFLDTKLGFFTCTARPCCRGPLPHTFHWACWAQGLSDSLPQQPSKGAPLAREEYLAAQLVGTCRRHHGAVKELAVPAGEDSVNMRAECAQGVWGVTEKHEHQDVRQTGAKTKKHAHAVLEGPGGVRKHTNRFLEIRQEPQRLGQCRQCAATPLPRSRRRQYQQVVESAGTLRRHRIPVVGIICPL